MRPDMCPITGIPGQCDDFAVDLDVNLVMPSTRGIPLFELHIRNFLTGGDICPVLLRVDGESRGQCGCPVWRASGVGILRLCGCGRGFRHRRRRRKLRESAAGSASNSFWVIFRFLKLNFSKNISFKYKYLTTSRPDIPH